MGVSLLLKMTRSIPESPDTEMIIVMGDESWLAYASLRFIITSEFL